MYVVLPFHQLWCKLRSCQPGRECKHRSSCLSCTWITRLATILTFLFGFVLNDNFSRNFTWLVLTFLFWFVLDYLEKAQTFPEIYLVILSVDKSWQIDMVQTWWGSRSSQQPRPPTLRTSHSQTSSLLTDQLIVKVIVANHRRLSLWSDALLLTTADHNLITSSHFWWITNCHFWICLQSICWWNHTASEVERHITETHVRHYCSILDKGEFSSCSISWPGTPIKLSIEKHLIDFQKMLPKCEIFNCRFLLPKKKPLYHLSSCIYIVYTRSGIMCKKTLDQWLYPIR